MKVRALALGFVAGGLLAQSGILPPLAGYIRDSAGLLRPVYGMAGNFVLGKPIPLGGIAIAAASDGPEAAPSLKLADGASIFAAAGELVYRKADGTETRTSLEGQVLSIERMGEAWIHIREAGRHSAVRVVEDRIEVYRLPEAAP